MANTLCKNDPAALLGNALPVPPVKNRAAITQPERLSEFLQAIEAYGGGAVVKAAITLLPHVFL
ncbi:hypothetical protein ABTK33_20925, partial [Acinetobacter baumannii]